MLVCEAASAEAGTAANFARVVDITRSILLREHLKVAEERA